jgi:hypothetical protein
MIKRRDVFPEFGEIESRRLQYGTRRWVQAPECIFKIGETQTRKRVGFLWNQENSRINAADPADHPETLFVFAFRIDNIIYIIRIQD